MTYENSNGEVYRDLALLQEIEADPDISQAKLAEELGVAIGTVNWHIKRLVEKGFVKVKRAQAAENCDILLHLRKALHLRARN